MAICRIDTKINTKAITNVALNITRSRPLLVKEVPPPPPHVLPSPPPFPCMETITINKKALITCIARNIFCMFDYPNCFGNYSLY